MGRWSLERWHDLKHYLRAVLRVNNQLPKRLANIGAGMSILIYGAGNIGSIYAGLLADAGHDVSILARGERLDRIRDHGVELEDFVTGEHTTA